MSFENFNFLENEIFILHTIGESIDLESAMFTDNWSSPRFSGMYWIYNFTCCSFSCDATRDKHAGGKSSL